MAIPQGRLSTTPQAGQILPPEDRVFYSLISYEKGPIAIEDTSEGMLYQNWTMNWDPNTGHLILTAETTKVSTIILTLANLQYFTFTFDQAGRVSVTYTNDVSSYMYWYDTELGQTVTTDLGSDIYSPSLTLDDRRSTQNTVNDMLLWYIKGGTPGNRYLYMARQRDRFQTEYIMASGIPANYIQTVGMGDNLRLHLKLTGDSPIPVPDPVEGLTDAQILIIVNNAIGTGYLGLYQFPQVTFDSLFGQSVDGGNVTAVIDTGQSFTVYPTIAGMGIYIEDDPVASEVTMLKCFPNGITGGFAKYTTGHSGLYVPLDAGHPSVIMVASDTGQAKLTKRMI